MKRILLAVGLGICVWIVYSASFFFHSLLLEIFSNSDSLLTFLNSAGRLIYFIPIIFGFLGGALASWRTERRGWLFGAVVGIVTVVIVSGFTVFSFFAAGETLFRYDNFLRFLHLWIANLPWFFLMILFCTFGGWIGKRLSN